MTGRGTQFLGYPEWESKPEPMERFTQTMPPKRRATLAVSVALIAAGVAAAAGLRLPGLKAGQTAQRLRSDVPPGQYVVVRDGNLYLWEQSRRALYRLPLAGGQASLCFQLPPDVIAGRWVPTDTGLFFVAVGNVRPSPSGAAWQSSAARPFLGLFRLGAPRPAERRTLYPVPGADHTTTIWRWPWDGGALQPVALPASLRSGAISVVAANQSGWYVTRRSTGKYAHVVSSKGVRWEYPADTSLSHVPLNGGTPQVLARNLSNPRIVASEGGADDVICWDTPRLYPDKTRDAAVCRAAKATPTPLPDINPLEVTSVASAAGGVWWLETGFGSSAAAAQLWQRLDGSPKPRQITPPLRQTEADTAQCRWVQRIGNRLYLLCDVQRAATPENPRQSAEEERSFPAPAHPCLMRLEPAHAGQPGFWGKSIELPPDAKNLLCDDNFLYFTRSETDRSLALAVQDVLSSMTAQRAPRTVLYRVPLP